MKKIRTFKKSLGHAISGLNFVWKNERNFRVQVVIGLIVVLLMFFLPLARFERIILLVLIFAVLSFEVGNSVVEKLVDMHAPRLASYARTIKDMMAAMVLITAIASVVLGFMILYPHLSLFL